MTLLYYGAMAVVGISIGIWIGAAVILAAGAVFTIVDLIRERRNK